ncbi:hypothetical protein ABRY74_05620 [Pseudomonas guariconensis]|uniref:hypothetical protein n=1 Tax=Pseudomonas guariconensis TaxID=1288410 RepID=UPI003EDF78BE
MDECVVGTQCTSQSGQLQPLEYLPGAGLIRFGSHRLLIDHRYHRVPLRKLVGIRSSSLVPILQFSSGSYLQGGYTLTNQCSVSVGASAGDQANLLALACKLVTQHPSFSRLSNDKAQVIAIILLTIILEVFYAFLGELELREFESRMLRHTHEIELALPDKAVVAIMARRKCT